MFNKYLGMGGIFKTFYYNYISLLAITRKELENTKFEYKGIFKLNTKLYIIRNKFNFILNYIYPINYHCFDYIKYKNNYSDKIIYLSKSFLDLLSIPNYQILNTLKPNYSNLIKEIKKLSFEHLLNNFKELIKKTKALNLYKVQKDIIIDNYQDLIETYLNDSNRSSNPLKKFFFIFCSIFSALAIRAIEDNSNVDLFFMENNGKILIINDNSYIHVFYNNISQEIKKICLQILNKEKNKSNQYIVLNEDNYLDIKCIPKFNEHFRYEFLESDNYIKLSDKLFDEYTKNKINLTHSFICKLTSI